MVKFPVPNTVKEVQSFLGLINYYRKFVPSFVRIARPLYALLEKQTVWRWTAEEQTAFETLRTLMTREPVLAFPDFARDFLISTDASNFAIGAVLKQLDTEG